jgi:hypothetical protein
MPLVIPPDVVERCWLSIEGASYRASLSPETIKRWLRRGILKGHKAGRRRLSTYANWTNELRRVCSSA